MADLIPGLHPAVRSPGDALGGEFIAAGAGAGFGMLGNFSGTNTEAVPNNQGTYALFTPSTFSVPLEPAVYNAMDVPTPPLSIDYEP